MVQISGVSKRIIMQGQVLSGSVGVSCTGLSRQMWVGCDQEQNRPGGRIWGGELVFGWGCG